MDLGFLNYLAQLAECPIFFLQKSLHPNVQYVIEGTVVGVVVAVVCYFYFFKGFKGQRH